VTDDMDEHGLEMEALKKTPFFAGLADEDLNNVLEMGRHAHFEPGQSIIEQGDVGDGMYIVLDGKAQVDVGGRFHNLGPGAFFGEMALIRRRRRSATVKAVEPVTAMMISAVDFRRFLLENPTVSIAMLEGLVDRLHEVQERIEAWMA
jgi:CRP-like cAMP-binding protein